MRPQTLAHAAQALSLPPVCESSRDLPAPHPVSVWVEAPKPADASAVYAAALGLLSLVRDPVAHPQEPDAGDQPDATERVA